MALCAQLGILNPRNRASKLDRAPRLDVPVHHAAFVDAVQAHGDVTQYTGHSAGIHTRQVRLGDGEVHGTNSFGHHDAPRLLTRDMRLRNVHTHNDTHNDTERQRESVCERVHMKAEGS